MPDTKEVWSRPFFYAICLILLYELVEGVAFPVTVRLLEDAICQQHYASLRPGHAPVHESMCKSSDIQSRLAFIRGWLSLFKTAPAIILGSYFGSLADQYGRRPIYAVSMFGMLLHLGGIYVVCHFWDVFDIRLVWLTGFFLALGGGMFVILALNMTMVSDLSTEADRSQKLYIAFALKYIPGLIGPQIASAALSHSLWLPMLLSCTFLFASFPVLAALPETLPDKPSEATSATTADSLDTAGLRAYVTLITDYRIGVCMAIAFLTQFRYLNETILVAYVPVRYQWSISQTSRLLSIVPAVSLIVFLSLPTLTQKLQDRFDISKERSSLIVVRTMLSTLVAGGALITVASSIPVLILALSVFALGNGVRAPVLAVASTYIDVAHETGRLYTLLSMTDGFSHMVGDPFIQAIWGRALELNGRWIILPFAVTFAFFISAFALSFLLPECQNDETRARSFASEGNTTEAEPLINSDHR